MSGANTTLSLQSGWRKKESPLMRLSVEQIRRGIVHPKWDVRDMALGYFRESFSADSGVMPHLIEAVAKYSWAEACSPYRLYRPLAQSESTVGWLIEQLQLPCPDLDRERLWKCWLRFLSWQLNGAAVELLVPHERTVESLETLDPECKESIQRRTAVAFMDPETGWRELECFCEQSAADYEPIDFADEDFRRLVEVILRDGNRFADRVLGLLSESTEEICDEDPEYWMHVAATQLAGHLRLAAAVPRLIVRFEDDVDNDGQWYCYKCAEALVRIGTDDVIRAVAERYPSACWDFRAVSARIFEGIHSEFTVEQGLALMATEGDDTLRSYLADSLLYQFDSAAIEPIRDLILRGKCDDLEEQMIRRLIAVSALMDIPVPEVEPWRDRARASLAHTRKELEDELSEDGRLPDDWDSDLEALENEWGTLDGLDEELENDFDEFDEEDEDDDEPALEDPDDDLVVRPIVQGDPKVGRNDPCPCGSGKKFKNCCMNRQKNPPKIDW
jgi:hypothetical protein